MLIVQTPLRISFLGGGTDFEDFYTAHGGAVLSTTIDKYVFVIVKERFDDMVYVNYSRKEIVDDYRKLEHELVREAMGTSGVTSGIEITTLADVPADGTGLASSSSVTVGLLQALSTYRNEIKTAELLAQEACHIEIGILGKPIGRQDQYIVAHGDLRLISFSNGNISVDRVVLKPHDARRLNDNLILFYTGFSRKSEDILKEQKSMIREHTDCLKTMTLMVSQARDAILTGDFDEFGVLLHKGWELKKNLASRISNESIDDMYETARRAGAIGGKITGSGGGGFLLLYCPKGKQEDVRQALHGLKELPFRFERDGTKVIFNYRRPV